MSPTSRFQIESNTRRYVFHWFVVVLSIPIALSGIRLSRVDNDTMLIASEVPSHRSNHNRPKQSEAALRESVGRAIVQLGSAKRAEREAASKTLLELGPGALAFLPSDDEVKQTSVRESLRTIREQLESQLSQQATLPSQLTLDGTHSVRDWVALIAEQSGNRVAIDTLSNETLEATIACKNLSGDFWAVFEKWVAVCSQESADFEWTIDSDANAIRLRPRQTPGNRRPLAVTSVGIHRIAIDGARWRPGPGDQRILRLQIGVTSEPRVRHLLFQFAHERQHLAFQPDLNTESKNEVIVKSFTPDSQLELPPASGVARFQIDLVVPPEPLPDPVRFRGEFQATVAPLNLPVRFAGLNRLASQGNNEPLANHGDGPKVHRQRRGGVQVELNQVVLKEEKLDGVSSRSAIVRIAVAYDRGGKAFESFRTWILHNEAYLESEQGERFPRESVSEPTFQLDGAVGMSYRFKDVSDPWRHDTFVYSAPALIIELPVKFELEFAPSAALPPADNLSP